MSEQKVLTMKCHKIAGGKSCGEALISCDDMCFYLVEPRSGVVIEKGHALEGRSIAGKVLIFPSGKGSSVVQADGLYQLKMKGTEPKAIIIQHPDTVLVASAIIMDVPLVDGLPPEFYQAVVSGDELEVDADNSMVTIKKRT
ncbi:predicted aconitase subunit 2 [Desulfotomaculum arcticum]|uniref:Predicted aconitase subunit 2 n=1 Tax=Desulfotruncus arcticus DSM 17038 TaxID=1121424 RepID=A0A1I2ZQD2_9FIRM|nr:DUF126 domain-containing protein [Desulfotruncus arcticus]SFH40043.1 predicted aconitase subunit 2 [Desulfotomaculum arcticum] [Desulfotruncus arcticus DSM 17038]